MKTCKDCIHDKLCDERTVTSGIPFVNANTCKHFKNKNNFIEVPCNVGDTVYLVSPYTNCIRIYEVVGFHIGDFPTLNGHRRNPYLVCCNKFSRTLKHIPIKEIGKTVFFNKEDAENSVKGR